jgi:hypothetical protein
MSEQAWLENQKASKATEEPSLDGVRYCSKFVDMITDMLNSR